MQSKKRTNLVKQLKNTGIPPVSSSYYITIHLSYQNALELAIFRQLEKKKSHLRPYYCYILRYDPDSSFPFLEQLRMMDAH